MKEISILVLVFVTCCSMGQNRILSPEDLLLKNYVVKEFNIKLPAIKRDIDTVLFKKNVPFKEILIYPGLFKLRSYEFSFEFGYSPFAIKVMDSIGNVLTFFTFTDELYYMSNDVSGEYLFGKKITITKPQNRKPLGDRNLEKNLNGLIQKLGYQYDQVKIKNLLNVIFLDLLHMAEMNDSEVQDLNFKLSKIKSKNLVIEQCIQEFTNLKNLCDSNLLCVKAKEGLFGIGYFRLTLR